MKLYVLLVVSMVEAALHLEYVHVPLCGLAIIVDKVCNVIYILEKVCIITYLRT